MYISKTPHFVQKFFPNFIWRIPEAKGKIYLTFDDGPIPEVTPWVLQELGKYNAKASFFCVGENVDQHPEIFQSVLDAGHTIGSHTYNHLSGWKTDNLTYLLNLRKAAHKMNTTLFRPPYGRMSRSQGQFIQRHYQVVMWDVLSGDFDVELSKEKCLSNVINNTQDGSIIVMHDSLKAQEKLEYVLPRVLDHFTALGYTFENLASAICKTESDRSLKIA